MGSTIDLPSDIEFILLKHNAYLKTLLDGESYNFEKGREITEKHGTKSASVSLMARNLSHNLGSHVLSYWNAEIAKIMISEEKITSEAHAGLVKSKELFQYIQHRMDFLADVSTSVPCSELSLDVNMDILKPVFLTPLEGEKKYGINDKKSILLEYIAGSEGLDLHNKIDFKIGTTLKSARISIPNGIIGTHAIYSIMENFIRNAAKHYKGTDKGEGKFIKIEIEEPTNDFKKKYLTMTIWDMREDSCNKEIVGRLKKFLPPNGDQCFLSLSGILQPGGWGMKEMLISANFLRKNSADKLYGIIKHGYGGEPPLIEILCSDNDGENGCASCLRDDQHKKRLGWRFYLRKPKDLGVVVSSLENEVAKHNINDEKIFEIDIVNLNDTVEIPFRILLVEPHMVNNYDYNPYAPCRILGYDDEANKIKSADLDEYYLRLYEKFIKKEIVGDEKKELPKLVFISYGKEFFANTNCARWFENDLSQMGMVVKAKWSDAVLKYQIDEDEDGKDLPVSSLLYYYHADTEPKITKEYLDKSNAAKSGYFQPVSGSYSFYARATNPPNEVKLRRHVLLELIESALTNVVIVDERISTWSNNIWAAAKSSFTIRCLLPESCTLTK